MLQLRNRKEVRLSEAEKISEPHGQKGGNSGRGWILLPVFFFGERVHSVGTVGL